MVDIIVDGVVFSVDESKNLIDELKKHNIEIPHFCYHEALGVSGNCRMCLIEVVGQKRPQIACDTPIKAGMEIKINSDLTRKVQRGLLELEFLNHPLDCPICDQAGECSLQEYYMKFDKENSRIRVNEKVAKNKKLDLGCGVIHDEERCVLCRRCVRFSEICTKTNDLCVDGRGEHSHINLFSDRKINNPYAGNIADICPVGAMTLEDFRFKRRVWHLKTTEAICQGCEMGCAIYADSHHEKYEDEKIYRFRSRKDERVNGHFICDYGRYSYKGEQVIALEQSAINASFSELAEFIKGGNFDILITSSLSLEEINACAQFSKITGANIFGYSDFIDKEFCDNGKWLDLRKANKTANAKGLEFFKINTDLSKMKSRILVFHLGDLEKIRALNFGNAFVIGSKKGAKMLCAGAYHRNGHTLNCAGVLREQKAVVKALAPSIEEILEKLSGRKFSLDLSVFKGENK